ncbi:hypothetical protein GW17_00054333 [Ensete ventricosum]|nr:hypothetical protein GW17_00054333 [Ensete ventricosum]
MEIPAEEATRKSLEEEGRGVPEVPNKRRAGDSVGQRKKSKDSTRHRLPHEADKSASRAAKGKGPASPVEETPTPRLKPRSQSARACSQRALGDRLDRGQTAYSLGVPANSLMLVLRALFDWVHDTGRVITSMDNRVDLLRKEVQRLKKGGDLDVVAAVEAQASEANARTQVWQMEIELLELTRSKDALWANLPRQAIEDYKKSFGFEMGLVRMRRVSLENGWLPTSVGSASGPTPWSGD